jgi:hypothetical protein
MSLDTEINNFFHNINTKPPNIATPKQLNKPEYVKNLRKKLNTYTRTPCQVFWDFVDPPLKQVYSINDTNYPPITKITIANHEVEEIHILTRCINCDHVNNWDIYAINSKNYLVCRQCHKSSYVTLCYACNELGEWTKDRYCNLKFCSCGSTFFETFCKDCNKWIQFDSKFYDADYGVCYKGHKIDFPKG